MEGSEPMVRPVLRVEGRSVELVDAPRDLLPLTHTDVRVSGRRLDARRFHVDSFVVRGVGGQSAWDGIVRSRRSVGEYELALADGSALVLRGVPEEFERAVGRRVWVVATGGRLSSYGMIGAATTPR
jgi:hypothetical protein